RQVELVAFRVLEEQEVALAIADLHRPETEVAPEAVVLVDDDVVDREIAERGQRGAALVLRPSQRAAAGSKDFRLGEHDDAEGGNREPGRALPDDHRQRFGPVERGDQRLDAVLAQDLAQGLGPALVGGGQADAESFDAPASDLGGELVEPPGEGRDLLGPQDELRRVGRGGSTGGAGHQAQLDELTAGEAPTRLGAPGGRPLSARAPLWPPRGW